MELLGLMVIICLSLRPDLCYISLLMGYFTYLGPDFKVFGSFWWFSKKVLDKRGVKCYVESAWGSNAIDIRVFKYSG